MLRRSLMNFHFRLIHTQSQLCARGGRGRTETISSSYDERLPNESDRDQAQPSIRKPRTEGVSAVDEALERKAASKRANLLDEAVTDYLKVETAETQEPWSSPTYPPEVIPNPRTRQSNLSRRPNIDPRDTSIFLFPGQGSQYVGMAKDLVQYPNVAAMFHCASEVLRYDLLKLCMEGPEEKLNRTVYCQPAIFVTSLACVEKVKVKKPVAVHSCIAAAGFSVGEIAALVFADAFSFEAGIKLIKARAEAMQEASERDASGLMSVFVRPDSKLNQAMADAIAHMKSKGHPEPVCQVANYLFTQVKVVGGHEEALQFIEERASEYNLRCKRLPVSGAFHTPLMRSAAEVMKDELRSMKIEQPLIPVYANVDGRIYNHPQMIKRYLAKQVTAPVRWEQIMHIIYSRKPGEHFPETLEMGPGKQLGIMLKKTNLKAASYYTSYDVSNDKTE